MSPRRSSRARTTQPSPLVPIQTDSSNSSVTSERAQRATRSGIKAASPQRSVPRLQSQDDAADDQAKPPPRRTRSGHGEIKEPSPAADDIFDEEEDEAQDENEITRCVCGRLDFPGMASPLSDMLKKVNYVPFDSSPTGDFFLQCDECKVWQHGGCVGIVDQAHSPDEYFCERCAKDDHRVGTTVEGQRYSRYRPVMSEPPYRQSPKPTTRTGKGKDNKSRQNAEASAQKRRQTMNSRQEEEDIERALEESRRETTVPENNATDASVSSRPGKRAREDSYEYVTAASTTAGPKVFVSPSELADGHGDGQNTADNQLTQDTIDRRKMSTSNKRQRTDSESPAVEPKPEEASETEPAEPIPELTPRSKIRGAAARNHQAKEAREAKERQRMAAASARQARSERRRIDESDLDEAKDEHIPSTAASSPPPEAQSSRSGKKKPLPGRRGRTAKNHQTREQESPAPEGDDNLLTANPHVTRARSRSRSIGPGDETDDGRNGLTPNGTVGSARGGQGAQNTSSRIKDISSNYDDGGLFSKPSKVKNFNEKRTSMNEMRKRVAAISEFIGRAQVERPPSKSTSTSRSESETGVNGNGNSSSGNGSSNTSDGSGHLSAQRKKQLTDIINNETGPSFGSLTTEEMIENMRIRTHAWQEAFGKYGDK